MKFGSEIRQLRLQAGMTQVEFASRIGVTNTTVSKWENERQTPSLDRMAVLRRVLGTNPGDQLPGYRLLPSTRSCINRTRVDAVVNGVVTSLNTTASIPGIRDAEVDRTPVLRQATIDRPGLSPDIQLPQDAGNVTDETGDAEAVTAEEIVGESIDFNGHATDPPGEHTAPSRVGELIDFDPHNPGEHPALSGVYVLYDISERPLYVGQGKAIDKRIRGHNDKFWFRSPIVETASYVQIDDKVLRERVEAVLIKFLKSNAVINKKLVDR
ncbi:MAG: helix-turn-helix domain-containing protein [Chloroflexi bacterium]|nr:helix-turn-helix domain-containing protein [Chloroflexota bacterium]